MPSPDPGPSLISPGARGLLDVLTPEPTPLSLGGSEHPAVIELVRAGLAVLDGYGVGRTIRLSRHALENGWARPNLHN